MCMDSQALVGGCDLGTWVLQGLHDMYCRKLVSHVWQLCVQDPCVVVLASAGCTFALFVPFLADVAFNFDAIRQVFTPITSARPQLVLAVLRCAIDVQSGACLHILTYLEI